MMGVGKDWMVEMSRVAGKKDMLAEEVATSTSGSAGVIARELSTLEPNSALGVDGCASTGTNSSKLSDLFDSALEP